MKRQLKMMFHAVPCSLIVLAGLSVSCGKSSKPDPISIDELKPPSSLRLRDEGNGRITLSWRGNNHANNFSGYNVYGSTKQTIQEFVKTGLVEQDRVVKIAGSDGKMDDKALSLLQAMSYNPNAPYSSTSEKQETYLPLHRKSDALPTCMPVEEGSTKCAWSDEAPRAKGSFSGTTWLGLEGLKVGTEYCFMVVATADAGKQISSVSSELRCVLPKFRGTIEVGGRDSEAVEQGHAVLLDLNGLRQDCLENKNCLQGLKLNRFDGQCDAATPASACVELFSTGSLQLTGAFNAAIADVGLYPAGFEDTIPNAIAMRGFSPYGNKSGYAPSAHSIPLYDRHIYVVASQANEQTDDSFFYDRIHVLQSSSEKGTATIDVMLAASPDQLD